MVTLSVDLPGARRLVSALQQWPAGTASVAHGIQQAERLSELSSGALGLLGEVDEAAALVARVLDRAIAELSGFRLSMEHAIGSIAVPALPDELRTEDRSVRAGIILAGDEVVEASEIVQRIRIATSEGRAPNRDDHTRLREIFGSVIADQASASAATSLALRGFPIREALLLETGASLNRVYGHIADTIEHGRSPVEAGLAPGLFPSEYRRHVVLREMLQAQGVELDAEDPAARVIGSLIDVELEDPSGSALVGVGGDLFDLLLEEGGAATLGAVSATARYFGSNASRWLGGALTAAVDDHWSSDHVAQAGQILAGDAGAAVGFYNALGAPGTAAIPNRLRNQDQALLGRVLPDFAHGLALASAAGLAFSGRNLIEAETDRHRTTGPEPYSPGVTAELLLTHSARFEPAWLVDAAVASLELRHDNRSWHLLEAAPGARPQDPRLTALHAIEAQGLAPTLVAELADRDRLHVMFDPNVAYQQVPDHLPAAADPFVASLAQVGVDADGAFVVVSYMSDRGGYAQYPRGTELAGFLSDKLDEVRRIDNGHVLRGVSAMLATSATHFVDQPELPIFLDAYDTVVRSGAGDDLVFVGNPFLLYERTRSSLAAGELDLDDPALIDFIAVTEVVRHDALLNQAELGDQAAANLSRNLSILGIASGKNTVVSTGASIASLLVPQSNNSYRVARQLHDESRARSERLQLAGMAAVFDSGRVRGSDGALLGIEFPAETGGFRIVDAHSNAIVFEHLGPMRDFETHRLDEAPFDELVMFIGGEPASLAEVVRHTDSFTIATLRQERTLQPGPAG